MQQISLADNWYVYPRDDAFSLVTAIPEDAVHTSVPYDALWHEGQRADSVNAGRTSYFDGQVYYFQRELELDPAWEHKRLLLKFGGIFSKSFVYVNGSQVAMGDFGYASLTADITDYVRFGAPNVLLVACKSDPLSSRWYAGCGIVRPVWLFVGEPVHVVPDTLWVQTDSIAHPGAVRIRVRAQLRNDGPAQVVNARLRVGDRFSCVLDESFPVRVNGDYELDRRFFLRNIRLWSEDDPKVYTVELTVGEDVTLVRTGLRTEHWDPERGLTINGRPVLLRGACVHHDEGILGGVANLAFEYWRVSRLKAAGFNAIRSAHNHASAELLAACDELGVYVLDEVCDMWTKMKGFGDFAQYFPHSWREVTSSLVREDRNHPCVVGYSTGNEISDINTERGFEVAHELYQLIHALDDTRFVTNGVNGAFAAGEEVADIAADLTGRPREDFVTGDVNQFMGLMATRMADITRHPVVSRVLERLDSCVDIQGYNYMTARYAEDAMHYPQRMMLGTETYPRQVAQNWELVDKIPAVIGEFTWTGWDYVGELGDTPYPAWQNSSGDVDAFGFLRPVSYWRQIVFGLRSEPYVAVRPAQAHGTPREFGPWKFTDAQASWTWDVEPGTPMTVEVYAPEGTVELRLNGLTVGSAQTSECYALFEVPWEPGTLEAITETDDRCTLSTVDRATLHEARSDQRLGDWLFSRIWLEDEGGNVLLDAGQTIDVTREGWELVAAGSAATPTAGAFSSPVVQLAGEGALAIYHQ
ncbi:MAG: glycoside hydrolase family 2 TIM barrel-domain containing protein [Coriobacteriales bacterium]|nr:glycoside hydrolase family 2 TIM barrel-domain containing protein [Coriobacteriales bacterium]